MTVQQAETFKLYGPHCPHDECSWLGCDMGEGGESGIVHPCRYEGDGCPYCGPADQADEVPPSPARFEWTCPAGCPSPRLVAGTEDALAELVER